MTVVHTFETSKGQYRLPTIEKITNLYLYGQTTQPEDLLDRSTWGMTSNI